MDHVTTLAQFTPSEAERITGVNTALQRDWRRRGILPSSEGHARFDIFSLSRMVVLRCLADRGVGPSMAVEAADSAAVATAWAALDFRDAWDGEAERALTWVLSTPPPLDPALAEVIGMAIKGGVDIELPAHGSHWRLQVNYLRYLLWSTTQLPRVLPAPLFIWWADGTHGFHQSFDRARNDILSTDPQTYGAIIVLDLESLGHILLERAGRAFVHVEFVEDGEGSRPEIEWGAPVPCATPKSAVDGD